MKGIQEMTEVIIVQRNIELGLLALDSFNF